MKKFEGYMAGANFGHWLSQARFGACDSETEQERYEFENRYFDTFMTEFDFKQVSEWGLDHIRLPVDYFHFEKDETPGVYDEKRLGYIDFALEMCKKYGLNMILDLHHAPGFTFNAGYDTDKNNLFGDPAKKQRYINIWKMFANRYKAEGANIAFELLNELVIPDISLWNSLWKETAEEVLKISPDRKIIIGGNNWNAIEHLQYIDFDLRDNFVYNFHTYEPYLFTHQRAEWNPNTDGYKRTVTYPFDYSEHRKYIDACVPMTLPYYAKLDRADKNFMYMYFEDAKKLQDEYDLTLYCGEYGVYGYADDQSAERWLDDTTSILCEMGIGHAVWNYCGFSRIIDADDHSKYNKKMVEYISRK